MAGYDDWKTTDSNEVSGRDYARAESAVREWYDDYEFELRRLVDKGLPVQEAFNAWMTELVEYQKTSQGEREHLAERDGLACDVDDGNVDEYLLDELQCAYAALADFIKDWQTRIKTAPVAGARIGG